MEYGNNAPRKDFDKTNTGTLEKNKNRGIVNATGRPDDRDFTGSLNVDGRWYFLSGKTREGKYGKFISLRVKAKDQARRDTYSRQQDEEGNRRTMSGDDFF